MRCPSVLQIVCGGEGPILQAGKGQQTDDGCFIFGNVARLVVAVNNVLDGDAFKELGVIDQYEEQHGEETKAMREVHIHLITLFQCVVDGLEHLPNLRFVHPVFYVFVFDGGFKAHLLQHGFKAFIGFGRVFPIALSFCDGFVPIQFSGFLGEEDNHPVFIRPIICANKL